MSTVQDAPPGREVAATSPPAASPGGDLYQFSAATFLKMLDAEVFRDEDRVELWGGWICDRMAKNKPHSLSSAKVMAALLRVMPPNWLVWPENPVVLNADRVPLPDYAVIRGSYNDYIDRSPVAGDVGLIIELSDSSLRFDTGTKLAGYAEAGIAVYWVVNLVANVVLTFERPVPAEGRYETSQTYAADQAVPLRLDGVLVAEVPAADLLPIRG